MNDIHGWTDLSSTCSVKSPLGRGSLSLQMDQSMEMPEKSNRLQRGKKERKDRLVSKKQLVLFLYKSKRTRRAASQAEACWISLSLADIFVLWGRRRKRLRTRRTHCLWTSRTPAEPHLMMPPMVMPSGRREGDRFQKYEHELNTQCAKAPILVPSRIFLPHLCSHIRPKEHCGHPEMSARGLSKPDLSKPQHTHTRLRSLRIYRSSHAAFVCRPSGPLRAFPASNWPFERAAGPKRRF